MLDRLLKIPSRYFLYVAALGTVILAVMLASIGGTLAKYARQSDGENIIVAKQFYFESDLLSEEGANIVLNSTTDSISFKLRNYADKLRFADDDISYTVTVVPVYADGEKPLSDVNLPALSKNKGTIGNKAANSDEITVSNLKKGRKYKVTATGSAGYEKILSAVFEISENEEDVFYYVKNEAGSEYLLLTVWTKNVSGNAEIIFDNSVEGSKKCGLIPDATDEVLSGVKNYTGDPKAYQEFSFEDEKSFGKTYSSHTYRFFYDKGYEWDDFSNFDFTVSVTNEDKIYPAYYEEIE